MAMTKKAPAATVSFGNLDFYTGGGGIPEGNYVWADLITKMHQIQNQAGVTFGQPRLGVMITLQAIEEPGAEPKTQFYSMGDKAHLSFMPNPADGGKSLVAVEGGPSSSLNQSTNWAVLLKSLYDCGLPQGIFDNDLTPLVGLHCRMAPTPPPKERASFQSKTSEVAEEIKVRDILTVTEIKDDGKPWEGTGGIIGETPAEPATAAKTAAKPAAKPLAKPAAAKVAAPVAPAAVEAQDDQAVMEAASNGVTSVLEALPAGCTRLMLRTKTFQAVKKIDVNLANAVVTTYFSDTDMLNSILEGLGYVADEQTVSPIAA